MAREPGRSPAAVIAEAAPAVARIASVSHRYSGKMALSDVTFDLARGNMIGLIGPDGVGKSTLLGLVAGVRRIQSGRIEVLGGDMAKAGHRRAVCARIAYMPQGLGRNLYPTLTVYENIDFFGRLFGQSEAERRQRIAGLLKSTGLDPFPDRPAGKLSGGMKQKLALCCALIHDPDLLILDEPTTGVDPLSRRQFWDLIARMRAARPAMSVIVATAYMSEAEDFEHLIAMDDGRILAAGRPEEIRSRTGTDTLEDAFVALLPEAKRAGHQAVVLPPRATGGGPPAIEADRLTKRFGAFTAVDAVSFRIEIGEIFGFLGSNGCGKTTTMKMLTGLLPASAGQARLFGKPVDGTDIEGRRRVGYMSQSFSLYSELTVRQNLALHAHLFHLPVARRAVRIAELIERFELVRAADSLPAGLPLGVRQRLQLAVAVLHEPDVLILDEPTSGVDPVARDDFWNLLTELSRRDGVTIFISTHFMNEAERCDRISLMHAGKVLAMGSPEALTEARGAPDLEAAFIGYLEEAQPDAAASPDRGPTASPRRKRATEPTSAPSAGRIPRLSFERIWGIARRETLEIVRDPIRLAFAIFGPLVLMLAMGYGISFDVEQLAYAALDQDRSRESRMFLQDLTSSRYFLQKPPLYRLEDIDRRMREGEISLAVVIPPDFGRDYLAGHAPEIAAYVDGSNASRAETARGYVQGVFQRFLGEQAERETGAAAATSPVSVETRFRYNQAFRSVYAIPPGVLMMLLIMIPAMLTALGVVREKEMGSIVNLYVAPAGRLEFLIGKQLPYVAVAMLSFATLVALMLTLFGIPLRGSVTALVAGALLYAAAATAFGLVVSSFVRSQIAAIFATSIIVMIPTINFSGMMYPVATLEGGARIMGQTFPAQYFQKISAGVFNKGLAFADLYQNHLALAGFCVVFLALAAALLRKQEP
jgi:ribosome-dependent ATPase